MPTVAHVCQRVYTNLLIRRRMAELGFPGEFPFTRGIQPTM